MLASLTTWLGQFPSMLFLLGYLLIIPAFAFIYGKLPSDFYNQTARLEPQVVWQRTAVENDLAARFAVENPAVVSNLFSTPYTKLFSVTPLTEGATVIVRPFFRTGPQSAELHMLEFTIPDNAIFHPWGLPGDQLTTDTMVEVEVASRLLSGENLDAEEMFPCFFRTLTSHTCLRMSVASYTRLRELSNTERGFPSPEQRSFSRMLYLSSIILTTLGFGDIVPITTRARNLVTAEVILGPIMIGFFLNSLSKQKP